MKSSVEAMSPQVMEHQAILESDVIDGLSISYIKILGLWKVINDYRTTGKRNTFIKCELAVLTLLFSPYILSQILSSFYIDIDIERASLMAMHATTASQIFCKMLVLWFRMEKQCRLFNLVRKDFLDIPLYKMPHIVKIYKEISKKANMICTSYIIIVILLVVLPAVYPDQSVDYILHNTGENGEKLTGRKKVLGGWYPLPLADSPYYECVYTYEALINTLGGIFLGSYGCIFFQVLMCLYAQFSAFEYHMSTLKVAPENGGKERDINNEKYDTNMYKELDGMLKQHEKLLNYADELKKVYNPLTTLVLGVGQLLWVITVFQFLFGNKANLMTVVISLLLFFYEGIEVCMFCFGSSFVETASADLHFAIYCSDWYKADTKYRKASQMIMMRCKKGVTLTAFRMYPVNVETLMSMLQFTYSVATLLSGMMK